MDADKQHPATIQKDEVPHPPSPFPLSLSINFHLRGLNACDTIIYNQLQLLCFPCQSLDFNLKKDKIPEERSRDLLHVVHTPFDQQGPQQQLVRCLHSQTGFIEAWKIRHRNLKIIVQ